MPSGKSSKKSSLGNSLINSKKSLGKYVTSNSDLHGYGKDIHQFSSHKNHTLWSSDGHGSGAGSGDASTSSTVPSSSRSGKGLVSVLDTSDLDELMDMATLSERDFTAESARSVVVTKDVIDAATNTMAVLSREEIAKVLREYADKLVVPRRPPWTRTTTKEALDAQERESFLEWRRGLAQVEADPRVAVTPFEKNLEVWRQLWRVMERSDVVFQVVDARDPMLYRCVDLEKYVAEVAAVRNVPGACGLILNKADLLSKEVRAAWYAYFRQRGVAVLWFSARRAFEEAEMDPDELEVRRAEYANDDESDETRVLTRDELLDKLEVAMELARRARDVNSASAHSAEDLPEDAESMPTEKAITVGLIGYPNVGKSSTINALLGAKRVAVAATPGKTKHFQTLRLTAKLTLCDCPGLVFPTFARSKSEMVVAGVIPVDRLTDVIAPVGEVCARVPRGQLESIYGITLPAPPNHELAASGGAVRAPTAHELLVTLAKRRGWLLGRGGYADETRAGRRILKDYCDGKLVVCTLPPRANDIAYLGELAEWFVPTAAMPLWAPPAISSSSSADAKAAATAAASTSAELGAVAFELADNTEGARVPGAELLLTEEQREKARARAMGSAIGSKANKYGHKKASRSKKSRGQDNPYENGSMWCAAEVKRAVPTNVYK